MNCKHNHPITRCPFGCLGWQVTIHDFWCQVAIVALLHVLYEPDQRRWELSYTVPPFMAREWQS
jgi:hypothetical protein